MGKHTLPKTYDFKSTEERIYAMWEKNGYFRPSNDPNNDGFDASIAPFVISIPPPNVTGKLHVGHTLFVSLQDLMTRHSRMKGIPTLWVPGSDHAGIATQLQVENEILRTEEITREEMGREEFIKRTWEWKEKYGGIITQQIRRLGASPDWGRERFTLDDGLSRAVREAFVRLYEKGLIYRGPRLINWSPGLKTAVSDLEVEYSEEPGKLYYFKYKLKDSDEHIPVATTRPETILGDTAVAVHPEDQRYKNLIGKTALVPILNREIPVIADEYVDQEFGTGALKITPGHDLNDYEIGQRHKLPIISILDKEAKVNQNGGPYEGLERFEARKKLWADMKKAGLVIKTEDYTLNVPRSQRGGEIIEPMISTQWFVDIKPLAKAALKAVKDGDINIVPDHFNKVYFNWLENIRDWCISRQLWWGHRIPVWHCKECEKMTVTREDPSKCAHCGSQDIHQDPDVLDTWFSSGLWPFSTLGWPEETPDLKYFYPTSVLETGYDILFFWVARMIMLGIEFTGQVPFRTVYLHGMVRDGHGRKMSKSLGNDVDPLKVMDELGTDALRFTMLVGSTPGKDTNLSIDKVRANRNFANKIWNATRLVITSLENAPKNGIKDAELSLADKWITARAAQLCREVERLFNAYQYGEAGRQIHEFFWSEFADWYLEISKLQLAEGGQRAFNTAQVLVRTLDTCLRLLHPFTPFVTEELWGHLKAAALAHSSALTPEGGWEDALIIARWPKPVPERKTEKRDVSDFAVIMEIVRAIRNLRAEKKVKPGQKLSAILTGAGQTPILEAQSATIASLAHLDHAHLTITNSLDEKPAGHVALIVGTIEIYLPLAELVDPAEERARLGKDLTEARSQIARLKTLLASDFANKAPDAIVQKERDKLAAFQKNAERLQSQLKALD